jgi:hypothetical protein
MRQLSATEIERFASRDGVRRTAVDNFLGTMGTDAIAAGMNLSQDARDYRWNAATMKAIRDGIALARRG